MAQQRNVIFTKNEKKMCCPLELTTKIPHGETAVGIAGIKSGTRNPKLEYRTIEHRAIENRIIGFARF